MSNNKVNYVKGSAKMVEFDNGGHVINVSIEADEIANNTYEVTLKDGTKKKYVNVVLKQSREPKDWSTHYIVQDEYAKSRSGGSSKSSSKPSISLDDDDDSDELPF